MPVSNTDLFVVQDPTDNKFYKLSMGDLLSNTAESAKDGEINFNAGNGLDETGDNATANQAVSTEKVFSVRAADNSIIVDSNGIKVNQQAIGVNDVSINFNAGDGLAQAGDATSTTNQAFETTKVFSVKADGPSIAVSENGIKIVELDGGEYGADGFVYFADTSNQSSTPADNTTYNGGQGNSIIGINDVGINFDAGNGLEWSGDQYSTTNQAVATTKVFTIKSDGASIAVGPNGIKVAVVDGGEYAPL